MSKEKYILAINPGSTSTKAAVFRDQECEIQRNLSHNIEEIKRYERIIDQFEMRMGAVLDWLHEEGFSLDKLSAVVGRGGILRPIPGGTYKVTETMIEDLKSGKREEHASNLGPIIAKGIGDKLGIPSFIVDPVSVDEFEEIARISGCPEVPRHSLVHALNVKAISRKAAENHGRSLKDMNLVVAHLGGGISVCPVKDGRLIDASCGSQGGPFSPVRSGSVPVGDLVKLAYSGKYTEKQLLKKTDGEGGITAYLGTNDAREVQKRIDEGDKKAKLVLDAMCYQISKEIIGMATVLKGKVDAIVLTGGLAHSKYIVDLITERVKFAAPVEVIPGENEMLSLCQGAYRVLAGEEKAKIYEEEVLPE